MFNPKLYLFMEQLTIIGNVGRAPMFRTRTDGKEYMMFSVACNQGDRTTWYSVVAPPLHKIVEYITPGKLVMCQGRPAYSIYNNNVDVLLYTDRVELLGGKTAAPDVITDEEAARINAEHPC